MGRNLYLLLIAIMLAWGCGEDTAGDTTPIDLPDAGAADAMVVDAEAMHKSKQESR